MKVITILGTRPEIIRLACVMQRLDAHTEHKIVHTGQNYDFELNEIFFRDLGVRKPDYFLNVDTTSLARVYAGVLIGVEDWSKRTQGTAVVFRLSNVFGKWCRPNYNSVVATFCHNIARDVPIQISSEMNALTLAYVDDVVAALMACMDVRPPAGLTTRDVPVSHTTTLGGLVRLIYSFHNSRESLLLPDFSDPFVRKLYATYLSYLPPADFSYPLRQRSDQRGTLAEFLKSPTFGQIFLSRTKPGITRGNHYHHTKTEKFMVVEGEAIIRFRRIGTDDVIEYRVTGTDLKVVDIPPGYIHLIENVGAGELVTLFWASEIFDSNTPDTFMLQVANLQGRKTPCV